MQNEKNRRVFDVLCKKSKHILKMKLNTAYETTTKSDRFFRKDRAIFMHFIYM